MSIPDRQVGWGNDSNLLHYILKQIDKLIKVISTSGGGGSVTSVVAGDNMSVNSTDPANPIVNLAADGILLSERDLDKAIPLEGDETINTRQILEDIIITDPDDYTLTLADAYKTIHLSKGTAGTITFPANSSVPIAIGTRYLFRRIGVGAYSLVAGGGVTVETSLGSLTDAGVDALFMATKTNTNEWYVDNGVPNNAVPTSRTLAGLDLSADRASSALNIALGIAPPYITGRLYGTALDYTAKSTAALTASSIRAQPLIVKREMSIDALVAEVTTVGSFNFRLAIYTDNGSGYPDALVAQTAELDGSTPAAPSLRTGAVSATLQPGLYWLCIVTAGSITFRVDAVGGWPSDFLGLDNSSQATIRQPYYSVAFTYASFPSTFPGGATINTNAGSGTNAPIVWVKKA